MEKIQKMHFLLSIVIWIDIFVKFVESIISKKMYAVNKNKVHKSIETLRNLFLIFGSLLSAAKRGSAVNKKHSTEYFWD